MVNRTRARTFVLATMAALATTTAVKAEGDDFRWYWSPMVNYTSPDSDRNSDGGAGFGVALGKPINQSWNIEAALNRGKTKLDAGRGDQKFTGFGIDALYFFDRNPSFAPYGVLGLGSLKSATSTNDDRAGMANVGLGFMKQLGDSMSLRADARYRWSNAGKNLPGTRSSDNFGDWLLNVGLNIPFGEVPKAAAKPLVAEKPAPIDSDGDGVFDDADRCPGTPRGVKVDAQGCPLDSDGDGVLDNADKCPDTPKGDRVDSNGCSLPKTINLKGVNFDNDKSKIRKDASAILEEATTTLQRYPTMRVEVAGHTDSKASDAYNQKLSESRAKAVADYFVSKGVAADRLTTKGYGESQPVADNKTAAGRAENRRVELRILN